MCDTTARPPSSADDLNNTRQALIALIVLMLELYLWIVKVDAVLNPRYP
jgi:hypothetical protein